MLAELRPDPARPCDVFHLAPRGGEPAGWGAEAARLPAITGRLEIRRSLRLARSPIPGHLAFGTTTPV